MAKKGSKFTATGIAFVRAAASCEKDPGIKNPDFLAIKVIPRSFSFLIKIRPVLRLVIVILKRRLPGNYYLHIVRTKHIDAILEQAVNNELKQLVILGAGLDTRAYRFSRLLTRVKIFEVDYPATQALKRERLAKLGNILPSNVTYVPNDFNTQGLETLLELGYSPALRTLFIWEGVCMYITPQAVDQVLSFVNQHSGSGSSIVFDYIFQTMVDGKCNYYGAKESAYYASKAGEPYIFGIEEGMVKKFLEKRGFRIISEFTPDMLERTYLKASDGLIKGKVCAYTNIVHATHLD
jgi:methyltransferase (TIGR00027 family)